MTSFAAPLSLPALLGVPAGTGCLLSIEQVRHIATLAVRHRPNDLHARVVFGGPLGNLEEGTAWGDFWQNAPFLVIAGEQGALALVSRREAEGFRCVILSDPKQVDHATMALAQFGDEMLTPPDLAAPEAQRTFIATLIAALVADPRLKSVDLTRLLPAERRWIELAHVSGRARDLATLFATPDLRQALSEQRVERALVGMLNANQTQVRVMAATGGQAPAMLGVQGTLLSSVLRSRRSGSASTSSESGLDTEGQRWLGNSTLTVVPLQRDGTLWGLLLAASQRPLATAARAALHGLGALISATHGIAAPTIGDTAPSGWASTPARPGAAPSSPRASNTEPSRARRQAALVSDLGAVFERLSDAVVLVDNQGRLLSYTPTAATTLALGPTARKHTLIESGASCLTPLLSEALMKDESVEGEVALPHGGHASVVVRGIGDALWSFIIHPDAGPESAPSAAEAHRPAPNEREQQETFLSNFSRIIHVPLRELRNLITSVPAAGELNEQQSRLIGQVVRLNSELTMLVNDLLSLGQIRLQSYESGTPLRLDLLIEATVGLQYAEFGRRGQHVTVDLPPGLPRVIGSEEGLGRAINALIDNAIKYSPSGANIRIAAHEEAGNVLVMIEDSGYGLSEDEVAQVFEPFYRAESAERAGVSGRGLGLTIAKAVIEQHGGQIWVDSRPGKGSTFTFRLPCTNAGGTKS